jgi:glucose/mannose-6-phosphate isomerase
MKPVLVLLRGDDDNPQVRNRVDETLHILRTSVADIVEVRGIGSGITQLLTTVQICDSASLFLACLRGIDPGPVNQIAKLKGALSSKTALIESLTAEVDQLSGRMRA